MVVGFPDWKALWVVLLTYPISIVPHIAQSRRVYYSESAGRRERPAQELLNFFMRFCGAASAETIAFTCGKVPLLRRGNKYAAC